MKQKKTKQPGAITLKIPAELWLTFKILKYSDLGKIDKSELLEVCVIPDKKKKKK
jgi:hypothetical protein